MQLANWQGLRTVTQDKTFNTETEAQWMRNKDLISSEDFVEAINFFHHTSSARPILDADATNQHHWPKQDKKEKIDEKWSCTLNPSIDLTITKAAVQPNQWSQNQWADQLKWKDVKVCRHKLQRTAAHRKQISINSDLYHDLHILNQPENDKQNHEQEWSKLQEAEQ